MKRVRFEDIIVYEDDELLVVNKPPFISTLEDRNDQFNLLSMGRAYHSELQACHRLDKTTSGCLVMAKNPNTYRWISLQFQNQKIEKVYHALINAKVDWEEQTIEAPIYIKSAGGAKIDARRGKEAVTVVRPLEVFKVHTLLECVPITGRLHQIRVHLAHIGIPIVGDERYGGAPFFLSSIKPRYSKSSHEERPLIKRAALHAYQLSFMHPDGHQMEFEADYPKDFLVSLTQLRKHL